VLSRGARSSGSDGVQNGNGALNGWARLVGVIGVPGAIAFYLVWWLTHDIGLKLDRMIQLLEQIARALKVHGI
jgi:hypothetical protein